MYDLDFNVNRKYIMKENKYVSNKNICKAFELLDAWEEKQLGIDSTERIHYSEEYERHMNRLLRAQNRPWWQYTNTMWKKVAVIVLVVFFVFSASMSVSAVRKPIVEFIINVYERFVEIFFGEMAVADAPANVEIVYTLRNVPEGYELVSHQYFGNYWECVWRSNEDLILTQRILDGNATLDFEDANYIVVCASDFDVICIDKLGRKMMYWNSEDYAFSLSVSNIFSLEECIVLIESLIPVDAM